MLRSVKFLKEHHDVFNKGEEFTFRPGVNLIVGDQGVGKSSLLALIKKYASCGKSTDISVEFDPITVLSFDFEKDNIRTKHFFSEKIDMLPQVQCLFLSHGQVNESLLDILEAKNKHLFLLDEPDMALSIRSCIKFVNRLKTAEANDCQIIASVHNPIIIKSFSEVLSVEHKKWMSSSDFVHSHLQEGTCKDTSF